jgi:hypothetical protein
MILRRHTVFDTMADYDPASGAFVTFSRKADPVRADSAVSGAFDYLDGRLAILFRHSGVLYLQIDNQRVPLHGHVVKIRSANGRREVRVLSGGRVVLDLAYAPPIPDPPLALDPTPFVEAEDFDFGLFLANVSGDSGRQARMYAGF